MSVQPKMPDIEDLNDFPPLNFTLVELHPVGVEAQRPITKIAAVKIHPSPKTAGN